jgi:Cu+-exporting ATPase
MVLSGKPFIDYSFVTGESEPVSVKLNEMVYAGGRQVGEQITVRVVKPVAGSYLTSLWNHYAFSKNKSERNDESSALHLLSKYFTWVLFGLAILTAAYWGIHDASKIMPSVTAMLIVACPCALLLSATFTNGNVLRILSNNGLYLRDALVIEQLAKIDHIVFDKTGTITEGSQNQCIVAGHQLTDDEKNILYSVVKPSKHPYSKMLAATLGNRTQVNIDNWHEVAGKGLEANFGNDTIRVGSGEYVGIATDKLKSDPATVYVLINGQVTTFHFLSVFRDAIPQIIPVLHQNYKLSLLSGDNDKQKDLLKELFAGDSALLFGQKPIDKLQYIESLQQRNQHVMMIGDGLNDAGALQQSEVGITLADDINNFTPSCDAILDAKKFALLPSVLKLAKASKRVIMASFVVSICYNVVGLWLSMQGLMKPMLAAILMPCSTISILLVTGGATAIIAKRLNLSLKAEGGSNQ